MFFKVWSCEICKRIVLKYKPKIHVVLRVLLNRTPMPFTIEELENDRNCFTDCLALFTEYLTGYYFFSMEYRPIHPVGKFWVKMPSGLLINTGYLNQLFVRKNVSNVQKIFINILNIFKSRWYTKICRIWIVFVCSAFSKKNFISGVTQTSVMSRQLKH